MSAKQAHRFSQIIPSVFTRHVVSAGLVGLAVGALSFSSVAAAQQEVAAPDEGPALDVQADVVDPDVTLQVVEDAQSVEDLLNSIELPEEVRELAEQRLAAALAAIKAAREASPSNADEVPGSNEVSSDVAERREAMLAEMAEMAERRGEMMADAQNAALAANEQAQQAVESAREAVEEALKNGLTSDEMQGMIEQMVQDILGSLPAGAGVDMSEVDALLESLRGDVATEPVDVSDATGS
ncbi:hypothetical protein KUV95_00455 [Microbulbifer agarilyticus]|uniref:hypothetical protein n=1 Tax=Microbulbifer agarilyticus TaxID=260552 RepID=UPI001C96C4A0|nr:hypothetical protein [Microbulbifer agarilyticus]MBY6210012.1 hypothetical protein [Microbulbifer agarilyticus]